MSELTEVGAFHLRSIRSLLAIAEEIFITFKKDCPHRDGVGCEHPDFHEAFALANICKLTHCPIARDRIV